MDMLTFETKARIGIATAVSQVVNASLLSQLRHIVL